MSYVMRVPFLERFAITSPAKMRDYFAAMRWRAWWYGAHHGLRSWWRWPHCWRPSPGWDQWDM